MMKMKASMVALAMVAVPVWSQVWAQETRTGVSHPDADVIVADGEKPAAAKPSAALPVESSTQPTAAHSEAYGAFVPYHNGTAPMAVASTVADADAQIVTSVEDRPGELREGTLLRARMRESLSTETAEPGTSFTAELNEAVMKDGRVILPVGSVLHGRVTAVHSGRRISGAAMLHLEAKSVDLPDGTHYPIHALLIDTDQTQSLKVDHEGSLVRRDHPKETLAAVGLATGGAATAGALLGGGVGAAVGAGNRRRSGDGGVAEGGSAGDDSEPRTAGVQS